MTIRMCAINLNHLCQSSCFLRAPFWRPKQVRPAQKFRVPRQVLKLVRRGESLSFTVAVACPAQSLSLDGAATMLNKVGQQVQTPFQSGQQIWDRSMGQFCLCPIYDNCINSKKLFGKLEYSQIQLTVQLICRNLFFWKELLPDVARERVEGRVKAKWWLSKYAASCRVDNWDWERKTNSGAAN